MQDVSRWCDRLGHAHGLEGYRGWRTFNCRVVFINEVTLDELDCEAAFAYSSAPYYHQLIFP